MPRTLTLATRRQRLRRTRARLSLDQRYRRPQPRSLLELPPEILAIIVQYCLVSQPELETAINRFFYWRTTCVSIVLQWDWDIDLSHSFKWLKTQDQQLWNNIWRDQHLHQTCKFMQGLVFEHFRRRANSIFGGVQEAIELDWVEVDGDYVRRRMFDDDRNFVTFLDRARAGARWLFRQGSLADVNDEPPNHSRRRSIVDISEEPARKSIRAEESETKIGMAITDSRQ